MGMEMQYPMEKLENFDSFKDRIEKSFKEEGLSERLKLEIEERNKKRYFETSINGASVEQRISYQIELAQIYGITEQYDQSWDVLSDVWTFADNSNDEKLKKEVENWMDVIHGKK
jgi:hypothetical protein